MLNDLVFSSKQVEGVSIVITPHAQHKQGKVIGIGVHMFVDQKNWIVL